MAGLNAVDLSGLPLPEVVEQLDYEALLAAGLSDLIARAPSFSALVESDPAMKLLEVAAYRELLVRARVNDGARAVMLAFATGPDLDNLAALFGVQRLVIVPAAPLAIPPVAEVLEDDASLRLRTQLATAAFSVAGPRAAYRFHALSAHPQVVDAGVTSTLPGTVQVVVLARSGDAGSDILDSVAAGLNAEDVRPLCDTVVVIAAERVMWSVGAELKVRPGPEAALIETAARDAVLALAARLRRVGRDVPRSAIYAALHQPGVDKVILTEPAADLAIFDKQAPELLAVTLTVSLSDDV